MPLTDKMPTAAKFFAAIGLALVGWFASEAIRPLLPPHTDFGIFNQVNVVLGVICGWRVTGRRVGGTFSEAISAGLTGVISLVFWGLFAQSFNLMLAEALDKKYKGPFHAIRGIFHNAMEYGAFLLDGKVIAIILIGGILTGLFADWISKRF
ncbi:MAG: TrgA family protein [Roseovarius sp.]|nr:TrgA family protein [Roseovarius sp.]